MVRFSNFECRILVDGNPLKEYIDAGDAVAIPDRLTPPTTIVYILAEEGKKFAAEFQVVSDIGLSPVADSVVWRLSFDGQPLPTGVLAYPSGGKGVQRSYTYWDEARCSWLEREFIFSSLDVTEDNSLRDKNTRYDSLGEIAVMIYRYKTSGPSGALGVGAEDYCRELSSAVKLVHEKDCKGRDISHRIETSQPAPSTRPTAVPGTYIDPLESPHVIIKFRYRSERALKGLGLIPRIPPPSPSPEPNDMHAPEYMTRKELLAEVRRLHKAENDPTIKRERPHGEARKRRTADVEVIDLTGDD
ncbi:hypothetical protein FN846DRAFT_912504 [Sphaerosporella brunnea]|nr:hypothetical protein FN846DRAFT_912504 [Sphaerosporella brunnea]